VTYSIASALSRILLFYVLCSSIIEAVIFRVRFVANSFCTDSHYHSMSITYEGRCLEGFLLIICVFSQVVALPQFSFTSCFSLGLSVTCYGGILLNFRLNWSFKLNSQDSIAAIASTTFVFICVVSQTLLRTITSDLLTITHSPCFMPWHPWKLSFERANREIKHPDPWPAMSCPCQLTALSTTVSLCMKTLAIWKLQNSRLALLTISCSQVKILMQDSTHLHLGEAAP
jgi:hypothetical protein